MKLVNFQDNRLKIKINQVSKNQFYELLESIKCLDGVGKNNKAVYLPNLKTWEALPTKNNIDILRFLEFEFRDDAKELLRQSEEEIQIILTNNRIEVKANINTLMELYNYFSCDDYSYCYVGGSFKIENLKKRYFFNINSSCGTCGIGLKDSLIEYLNSDNYKYSVLDKRTKLWRCFAYEDIKNNLTYLTLVNYQIEAIVKCIEEVNGIVKLPTGSGKTEIFLSLCNLLDIPTLILFNRIDLARQTLARAEKAGLDAGIVQGSDIREDHKIIMCTVQSAHKLKNKYEMVIIDEVHESKSKTYQKILRRPDFIYRFGFSATPFPLGKQKAVDRMIIKRYIGDIIYTASFDEVEAEGRIIKPKIKFIEIDGEELNYKRWLDVEWYGIVNNEPRNCIIKMIAANERNVLILVRRREHGNILEGMIYNSIFIDGESSVEVRRKAVEEFEHGWSDTILIASSILDQGISIDSIENLINAGGGKSDIKTIQKSGRGTRNAEGKTSITVYDFDDNIHAILKRHSKERRKSYLKEGFEIL